MLQPLTIIESLTASAAFVISCIVCYYSLYEEYSREYDRKNKRK